ncbi:MAG: DUF3575 domain-containing protein [Bacteroidetes bacterium]|nr:DUF3575 domain-containing protein [Bacteroidota bacterium]
MKKVLIFSIFAFLGICSSIAQDYQHVIKWNVLPAAYKNFSFQYEKTFHEKMSGAVGFSYMPSRSLFSFGKEGQKEVSFGGYSITPEFRYYVGRSEAPYGFYFAPYLRFAKFKVTMDTDMISEAVGYDINEKFFGTLTGFGGGLMIGSQWILGSGFSLDWWIVGAHFGFSTLSAGIEGDFNLTASEQYKVRPNADLFADKINAYPGFNSDKPNISANSVSFSAISSFAGIRSGLTIGWAF